MHWDESRQRWIGTASLGYDARGRRIIRKVSDKSKTRARDKLKEVLRDYEDGLALAPAGYTVADAVHSWLSYGLRGRDARTVTNYRGLCETHVIGDLGACKLRELSAEDVDRWLTEKSKTLSTRTLRLLHSCLNRSVKHAQARDKVKRNVVALCEVPTGLLPGRPSKSLTLAQAEAVLTAVAEARIGAYIVLSLLTGARTEELRALTWDHVDLDGRPDADPPVPPSIAVWRSVRAGGDTKTRRSRRTLALPDRCVTALRHHRDRQATERTTAGKRWQDHGLVFASVVGTPLDAHNVRRAFRTAISRAGLEPDEWTPRELRHSFVSLLSDSGVPIEHISRLVGHSGTTVSETIYRKQIRPVIEDGAQAMDALFPSTAPSS